jgi:hypothetical protein
VPLQFLIISEFPFVYPQNAYPKKRIMTKEKAVQYATALAI